MTTYQEFKQDLNKYMKGVTITFIKIVLLIVVVSFGMNLFGVKVDDTDKNKWTRSGMRLRTDHGTGVQYLESADGVLTPRLNADGSLVVIVE